MNEPLHSGRDAYRGEIAKNYEHDRRQEALWRDEDAWMASWAHQYARGKKILDLPTGTGRFLKLLLDAGTEVYAVDISDDMLEQVRLLGFSSNTRLHIVKADAASLPFEADAFDYVHCWRFLHLLPPGSDLAVLREFARVCKGEIVLEVFGTRPSSIAGYFRAIYRRILRLTRRFAKRRDSEIVSTWSAIASYRHTEKSLKHLFLQAGLRCLKMDRLPDYNGGAVEIYRLARIR